MEYLKDPNKVPCLNDKLKVKDITDNRNSAGKTHSTAACWLHVASEVRNSPRSAGVRYLVLTLNTPLLPTRPYVVDETALVFL